MKSTMASRQSLKMLAAGTVLLLFLGIVYIWSVFVIPVSNHLQCDINKVKLTSSFMMSFFVIGLICGGKWLLRIGAQKTTLLGGLIMAAGMLGAAYVPKGMVALMYVTYGMAGGFGAGASYGTAISSVQKWFPQKRGIATGICVCAYGFSAVIFTPLAELLINSYGVRLTFIILSCVYFSMILVLFSFITQPGESKGLQKDEKLPVQKQYSTKEILKTKEYYLIALSFMFGTAAYFILNPSFKTMAEERGLHAAMGTALVMITGVANALGRLCIPFLSEKIGRIKGVFLTITVTALCVLLLCFAESLAFMAVVALVVFCFGGIMGTYPVITSDFFGVKNVGSNYGAVNIGYALSSLLFPITLGLVNNTILKFAILAAVEFTGAVFIMLLQKSSRARLSLSRQDFSPG